jgi:aspartyl-tRNA(Asn)/glutamyl-tRNA(Gln) amidotransferase subunit A
MRYVWEAAMTLVRRQFLHLAAGAAAISTFAQSATRAQAQAPLKGTLAKRSARDRLEEALARIADPKGEGVRACLTVYSEAARNAADAADVRARAGITLGPLDGAIITIKDLFDVAGEPTRAGSKVLVDAPPAVIDAPVVHRLRAGGGVVVAKTNMVEFAFSGVGVNPHYGTPGNPVDRKRVPGGSSSGAAVAAADGMCEIAIGTDTGGSTRIPASLCGVVGYKPSKWRVPTEGAFPLSYTLDSIGPIARSVASCAAADAVMAGDDLWTLEPAPVGGLRLGIPQGLPLRDLDQTVAAKFSDASGKLGRSGVRLSDELIPLFDDMVRVNSKATFAVAESYYIHRDRLSTRAADYDPFVRSRIEAGRTLSAADYMAMARDRAALVRAMDARLSDLDALVLPTTAITAPTIAEVSSSEGFTAKNGLLLRNTAIGNFFDLCAISLPLPPANGLPVGLMLMARNGHDRRLFRIATAIEQLFSA